MVKVKVNSRIQVPLLLWYGINFFCLGFSFVCVLVFVFGNFLSFSGLYVLDNKCMFCFPQFPGSLVMHKCCETSVMEEGLSKFLERIKFSFQEFGALLSLP